MSKMQQPPVSEATVLADIRQQLIELEPGFAANQEWCLEDGGLDSFVLLSFALSLEERYGIQFSGDDLESFRRLSMGDLASLTHKRYLILWRSSADEPFAQQSQ